MGNASVAQQVEQLTRNEQVARSNRVTSSMQRDAAPSFAVQFSEPRFLCPGWNVQNNPLGLQ